jgi:hypothetical protein
MAQISRQKELVASWLLFSTLESSSATLNKDVQYLEYSESWMLYRDEFEHDADMRIIKT